MGGFCTYPWLSSGGVADGSEVGDEVAWGGRESILVVVAVEEVSVDLASEKASSSSDGS
jgi:hypothetical protein